MEAGANIGAILVRCILLYYGITFGISLCITSSSRRRHKRPLNEPLCVLVPLVKWATSTSADITGLGSPPYDTWRCRTTVASYDTRRCRTTVVSYDTWRCRTTVVSHDGPEVSYDGSVV